VSLGNTVAGATGFLRIDASGVDQGVNQASNALDRLTNISRNSYFGLRNIGVAFEAVGDAAVAGIGLAVDASVKWEQSLAQVDRTNSQVTNGVITNGAALNTLHDQLQAIVALTPTSPTVVGQIATEAGQLGIHTADVANFTKVVVDLVATTGAAPDAAAQGLARIATLTGTTGAQYEALGSTIEEVQRKSGASISQIVDNTTRLAGIGTSFKLTQGDIAGIGGALAALGIQGRIGITAVSQAFSTMDDAVQNGGAHLANFASVSGVSVDRFKQMFQEDAAGALQVFVQGLANAIAQGKDITPILESVGLTQQGVTRTLRQLAVAQADGAGTAQSLTAEIEKANAAFGQGNALSREAARLYGTTSNQLKILHNDVTIAALSFGALFMPALKLTATVLQSVALGLASLPGPARGVLAVVAALAAGIGVVGGAILLVLPRFLIARDTLIQLAAATSAQAGAQGRSAATTAASAGPMATLIALTQELVATQLVLLGEYETLPEALAAVNAATAEAAVTAGVVAAANIGEAASMGILEAAAITLQAALGPIGLISLAVGVVVTGLIALLGHLGQAHKDAAKEALAHAQADQTLADILSGEADKVDKATNAWILHKLATDGSLASLEKMGISTQDLVDLVKGTLPQNRITAITAELEASAKAGDENAKKAVKSLLDLTTTYATTVSSEQALAQARKDGTIAADDETTAADNVGNANLTAAQKADKAAQASQNYASDLLAEKQAANQVEDAQVALSKASDDLANKATILGEAEDKVAASQTNELVAADKLAEAQRTLARARADAQKDLDNAVRKEVEDQLSVEQATINVAKAQKALGDLHSADTANKLTDATNALKDAQLGLVSVQQSAADAQWYLTYLQGEGASKRDIQDAQNALAEANQKVADQTGKIADSQEALDKLTDPVKRAQDQTDAELALEQAENSLADAQANLAAQQQVVADKRADVVNDTAYHDALLAEETAEGNVKQAHLDTTTALQNLHAIQDGSIERAFATAQLNIEGALIQQAKAITDTQRDHEAMQGTFWTSQQYANALGGELITLGQHASGPVRTDLINMGTAVQNTATNFHDLGDKAGGANTQLSNVGPSSAAAISGLANANAAINHHASLWDGLKKSIGDAVGSLGDYVSGFLHMPSTLQDAWKTISNPLGLQHAEGGLFTQPHVGMVAEDGPELILPLTNLARTQQLLAASGVLDMLSASSSAAPLPSVSGGVAGITQIDQSKTVHEGDLNVQTIAQDPEEIMREWSWERRLRTRSAVA
jgi:TP901 family phage tail tape measure protein